MQTLSNVVGSGLDAKIWRGPTQEYKYRFGDTEYCIGDKVVAQGYDVKDGKGIVYMDKGFTIELSAELIEKLHGYVVISGKKSTR